MRTPGREARTLAFIQAQADERKRVRALLKPGEKIARLVLFADGRLMRADHPDVPRCRAETKARKACRHVVSKDGERCDMHKGQCGIVTGKALGE